MWDKIWDKVRDVVMMFFGPPDVDDEVALKAWLTKMLGLLDWFAARTRVEVDDKIVDALQAIVETPAKWAVLYGILVKLFGDGVIGPAVAAGNMGGVVLDGRGDVTEAAGKLGLPIGFFVQLLLFLLKLFRR